MRYTNQQFTLHICLLEVAWMLSLSSRSIHLCKVQRYDFTGRVDFLISYWVFCAGLRTTQRISTVPVNINATWSWSVFLATSDGHIGTMYWDCRAYQVHNRFSLSVTSYRASLEWLCTGTGALWLWYPVVGLRQTQMLVSDSTSLSESHIVRCDCSSAWGSTVIDIDLCPVTSEVEAFFATYYSICRASKYILRLYAGWVS